MKVAQAVEEMGKHGLRGKALDWINAGGKKGECYMLREAYEKFGGSFSSNSVRIGLASLALADEIAQCRAGTTVIYGTEKVIAELEKELQA